MINLRYLEKSIRSKTNKLKNLRNRMKNRTHRLANLRKRRKNKRSGLINYKTKLRSSLTPQEAALARHSKSHHPLILHKECFIGHNLNLNLLLNE